MNNYQDGYFLVFGASGGLGIEVIKNLYSRKENLVNISRHPIHDTSLNVKNI